MSTRSKQLISVAEARKLLGKEARNYTDEQVEQIISDTTFLAELAIDAYKMEQSTKIDGKH